jgi:ATP-dependent Clp protease ATP-binding subunit ClpA
MARGSLGFGKEKAATGREIDEGKAKGAIERVFSPEFRNRLDAWIVFHGLPRDVILRVVDKELTLLQGQLADKRVTLEVDDPARAWLAEHGYDPAFGARPMGRLIEERIKRPLAEALLFGALTEGGTVRVTPGGDGLELAFLANADG